MIVWKNRVQLGKEKEISGESPPAQRMNRGVQWRRAQPKQCGAWAGGPAGVNSGNNEAAILKNNGSPPRAEEDREDGCLGEGEKTAAGMSPRGWPPQPFDEPDLSGLGTCSHCPRP